MEEFTARGGSGREISLLKEVVMKKKIAWLLALCLVFTLSVMLVNCSGGKGGGGQGGGGPVESAFLGNLAELPVATPATYQEGTTVIVTEETIGDQGGTLTGPAGTPVEGVVVTVPAGALSGPTALSLGYDENGVFTNVMPDERGVVMVLSSSGSTEFLKPIKVEYPFTGADRIPVPYYIHEDGTFEIVPPLPFASTTGRAGFITMHVSKYTGINLKKESPPPMSIGFDPKRGDGFKESNAAFSKYADHGRCMGMSNFAKWYWSNVGSGLYGAFNDNVPSALSDYLASGQKIISVRAHNSVAKYHEENTDLIIPADNFWVFIAQVKDALSRGGRPVMISLNGGGGWAHAVLAIGFSDRQIAVYDPNKPADTRAIDYAGDFEEPYGNWTQFAIFGNGELQLNEKYEHLLLDAAAQFHGENETKIEITSHTYGQKVSSDDVSLEGRIRSGQVLISEIEARVTYDDGSESAPITLPMPPNDDTFKLPLTLKKGSNVVRFKTRGYVAYLGTQDIPNAIYEGENFLPDGFLLNREADARGTFTIDLISPYTSTPFHVEADATLTFIDEGPDLADYALGGVATMKTTSFYYGDDPGNVCVLDTAALPIEHQSAFNVIKIPQTAVRWSFAEKWTYTCNFGGYVIPAAIYVYFQTAQGLGCSEWVDVPVADPLAPAGSFTSDCAGAGIVTATWDFSTY